MPAVGIGDVVLGPQVCGSLDEAVAREWMVADGLGGYAMGTVAGLRTRGYHGLLMVAGDPVGRRRLGLVGLEATVVLGDRRIPLATHERLPAWFDSTGHEHLVGFDLTDGVPRWRWQIGAVVIEREVAMQHGRPAVGVVHRVLHAPGTVRLELTARGVDRDGHERQMRCDLAVEGAPGGCVVAGRYRVHGRGFAPGAGWRQVHLREEAARGEPDVEHERELGTFTVELVPGEAVGVEAWAGDLAALSPPAGELVAEARQRAKALVASGVDALDGALRRAADQMVVTTPTGPGVVAGYPWFGEWSRDTMLCVPGLLLSTGRLDEARALLRRWAVTLDGGMLANTTDSGRPEHNTVDGTLWYVHALGRYVAATGDDDLASELVEGLDAVVERHLARTRYGIRVDTDGLVTQGVEGVALTWMDARCEGRCITPRRGKPVEVNALWIAALATTAALRARTGGDSSRWSTLEAQARASFLVRFTGGAYGGRRDLIDGPSGDEPACRPNQLLAGSLAGGPGLDASAVVACRDHLLTPLGLRTLDPGDPAYCGSHHGARLVRDEAYHQGTAWPWLVGPYVEAALAAGIDPAPALATVEAHLGEWGLGSISETAEGDAPHAATGCPFQAWSVAEVLRAHRLVAARA